MGKGFQVEGQNPDAPFTLKLHRGEGMLLVAMNWRHGKPPGELAGFAIEYREPGRSEFFPVKDRLSFPSASAAGGKSLSTRESPVQRFRWVHFPRNAEMKGEFMYRATPVFMDARGELSYGAAQEGALELGRETHPGKLYVAFTRGYVSSQAFVDRYESKAPISTLLPGKDDPLKFVATHPLKDEALAWMGFEARAVILDLLDRGYQDADAQVSVVAYDLDDPEVIARLAKLKKRLRIIVDDSADHGDPHSPQSTAAGLLEDAGAQVRRQHLAKLQHNKTILVDGSVVKEVICGSTNLSWRGLYVQSNNAVKLQGAEAIAPFGAAFTAYWGSASAAAFARRDPASWHGVGLAGVDTSVTFAPMSAKHATIDQIAKDIAENTTSSLFYSLAFLYQTPGALRDAIKGETANKGPVRQRDVRQGRGCPRPPEAGRQRRAGEALVAREARPRAVQVRAHGRERRAPAPQVCGHRLRPAHRARVHGLVQLRRRGAPAVRRVSLPRHTGGRGEGAEGARAAAAPADLAAPPWWTEDYSVASKIRDRELFA